MKSCHTPATALCVLLLACAGASLPGAAHAAASYDNCTGFIDTLPATLTSQGTWCLRQNLSSAMASGVAITVAANNVTVDCNDFKIGGIAAGNTSMAAGIHADGRLNVTVRNCGVRGFAAGIVLGGGDGHLVEGNRLDQNLIIGINIGGDGAVVRDNRVYDTGGRPGVSSATGIQASGDILDNLVSTVYIEGDVGQAEGIVAYGGGTLVSGNRVRGIYGIGAGNSRGIDVQSPGVLVRGNLISNPGQTLGTGIKGYLQDTLCTGNVVLRFNTPYSTCDLDLDNQSLY